MMPDLLFVVSVIHIQLYLIHKNIVWAAFALLLVMYLTMAVGISINVEIYVVN